ncbi:MAG: hypothetical protein KC457_00190 [Myxococcales bacterium]|nr:hypothetical protein [Myxococcales bacterium]
MPSLPIRAPLGVIALAVLALACVDSGNYGVRGRYPSPEPEPAPATKVTLASAHLGRVATAASADPQGPEPLEPAEDQLDRILLVFSHPVDALTLDPRAFAVLRGDGHRVAAVRATLAPADEGDEHRSVTLLGHFGAGQQPPVTVYVFGEVFAASGEPLRGLSAEISALEVADRPVVLERLAADAGRCPGAKAVLRSYWSDQLGGVGEDDLAGIDLRFADGSHAPPVAFDDQARREGEPALPGPADDNVLDLCIDREQAVVEVRFAAGLFRDDGGRETAAAQIVL